MRTARVLTVAAAWVIVSAPSASAAVPAEYVQINAVLPPRVDGFVGFIPINGIDPTFKGTPVRVGGRAMRLLWNNATASDLSTTHALRNIRRRAYGRPTNEGAFADRRPTASERSFFTVLADVARDADVLVVAAGHPACSGLTRTQARSIARGRATRWSHVGAGIEGGPDEIALRVAGRKDTGFAETRLGSALKQPKARIEPDGGLRRAASGDMSVAAVTSWSRARGFRAGVCAVPLDGVAPSDETVTSLAYREAYPILWVAARRRPGDGLSRATMRAYVDFLLSPRAGKLFARTGLLTVQKRPG